MKKHWIVIGLLTLFLSGCDMGKLGGQATERAEVGRIGNDIPISREMTAKTIALAFYTPKELEGLESNMDFSDVKAESWAYPYICGSVEKGFFSGDEEGHFRPKDDLTLWEAQALMDRLAPDYDSRILLTDENKNMSVSYDLWAQLLETALKSRRGEENLYSYGIHQENAVLLTMQEKTNLFDTGSFTAAGQDLSPYENCRITFLEKEGEILLLQTVEALSPVVRNIYCRQNGEELTLLTGEGTAVFPYGGKVEEGLADVKLTEGKVTEVTPAENMGRCTVKRVDKSEVYLAEKGLLPWADGARIYHGPEELKQTDFTALICGTDGAEYYEKNGEIVGAVIRREVPPKNIRVFLKGQEQPSVTLSAKKGFSLSNGNGKKEFPADAKAALTADLPWFDFGIVTAEGKDGCPIRLEFADGTAYDYEGRLELERRQKNSFSVLNELPMERYLLGVVPHEMPTAFGQTALEAQAITARSYAYQQFFGNTYCEYGAHVTDTVASQVYLGFAENETARAAIKATEGLCAVTDGKVAMTYYYSTSGGFGAGAEEVWSKDGTFGGKGKSYLKAQAQGDFETPTNEEEWLAFWQDWQKEGYDMDSPWYRWKVYFGCGQLSEILEKTMAEIAKTNPFLVEIRQEDGSFRQGTPSAMGRLKKMEVTRRGGGGIIMELQLEFEKGTVRVKTEYAIRQLLSPTRLTIGEPIYLQRKSGDSLTGNTMLPSGYFAVKEMRNDDGKLTGIALYGGGSGHGVGMSQYGVKKLAEQGKTAAEIIAHYFPGTTVEKVM